MQKNLNRMKIVRNDKISAGEICSSVLTLIIALCIFSSCDSMDDTYKEFIEDGQIIYSAKLDSINTYPGRNRILITWNPIKDPRITKVSVSWSNKKYSAEMPITSSMDTVMMIENLDEGNYTFDFYTFDDKGNRSMKVEALGLVYGENYENSLLIRAIESMSLNDNILKITFRSMDQTETYIYQEIVYTSSMNGEEKTILVASDIEEIEIDDYSGNGFIHRSVYKPSDLSPDLFYSSEKNEYTPIDPMLVYPVDGDVNISCATAFKWHNSVIISDGAYTIKYSTDKLNWQSIQAEIKENLTLKTILNPHTRYYWKVEVSDGKAVKESEIYSFTTGEKTLYADGEAVCILNHSTGLHPVRITFTGDGFQQSDFTYHALFDRYIDEAVEAFFSVEPYKSYKPYFEVWKIAAYSDDSGISESDKSIRLNTVYSASFSNNSITCDTGVVNHYVKKIPGIDEASLSDITTIVILNKKRYGGYTYASHDHQSISLVPIYRNSVLGAFTDFKNILIKQGGGFGFGLLADESSTMAGTLSLTEENLLREAWDRGRFLNVDLTSDPSKVRWAHFINLSGYIRPGVYEGAYGYKTNIYRSEENSCMVNGISYFNAISRELIVKRILKIAGETYNFNKFVEKDVSKTPYN
jgi:predicted secreted protein